MILDRVEFCLQQLVLEKTFDHPLNVSETGDVTGDKGLGENAGVVRIDYSVELRKTMKSNNTGVS